MNATFEQKLQSDIDKLKTAGTYKSLRHITTPMAPEVHMEEAGDVIVLSSNNYLGLSDEPSVIAAGKKGLTNMVPALRPCVLSAERSTSIARSRAGSRNF